MSSCLDHPVLSSEYLDNLYIAYDVLTVTYVVTPYLNMLKSGQSSIPYRFHHTAPTPLQHNSHHYIALIKIIKIIYSIVERQSMRNTVRDKKQKKTLWFFQFLTNRTHYVRLPGD